MKIKVMGQSHYLGPHFNLRPHLIGSITVQTNLMLLLIIAFLVVGVGV